MKFSENLRGREKGKKKFSQIRDASVFAQTSRRLRVHTGGGGGGGKNSESPSSAKAQKGAWFAVDWYGSNHRKIKKTLKVGRRGLKRGTRLRKIACNGVKETSGQKPGSKKARGLMGVSQLKLFTAKMGLESHYHEGEK